MKIQTFGTWRFGLAATCALALGTGVAAQKIQINGAGATFPNPIYSKWFSEYNKLHPNVEINYQSIGSGGGIRQITNQTVFFGATDGPMTNDQLLAAPGPILHFPTVLGADVPVYNVPGVASQLKFTGTLLADIFLGKITRWNDPAIATLNPGTKLPSTNIAVAHRSDGSGTTYIWVDYLTKVSPEWKKRVGVANSVNWPVGLGGAGNEGVAVIFVVAGCEGDDELSVTAGRDLRSCVGTVIERQLGLRQRHHRAERFREVAGLGD